MSQLHPWIEQALDRLIQTLQNDTTKKKIQLLILQPFLQYFIDLLFPYLILILVIFGLMIILMIGILVTLIARNSPAPSPGPFLSAVVA
jgi:hypothetical protein